MSDSALTQLSQAQISPPQFVSQVAAEIKGDAEKFNLIPGAGPLEAWAVERLQAFLAPRVSPTIAGLIVHALQGKLGLPQ